MRSSPQRMPEHWPEQARRRSTGRGTEWSLLTGTTLESATVAHGQHARAKSLKGATLPDGAVHE
jgi:hypothetical protein